METNKTNNQIDTLYIIGNGFDLNHGVQSSYRNFKEYVEIHNPELYEKLDKYFDYDLLWADFEAALAEIDMEPIEEECSEYIVSMSSDEWRDRDWHVYSQEVNRCLELITMELRQEFVNWVLSLTIPDDKPETLLQLDNTAHFLNFNYTGTLQRLYNVKPELINYIHCQAIDAKSELVLGHGRPLNSIKKHSGVYGPDDYDYVIEQGNELLDRYYFDTFKPSQKIIIEQAPYFTSLNNAKEIHIYGLSLSMVDRPYIEKIAVSVRQDANWIVSYYNPNEIPSKKQFLNSLGITDDRLKFVALSELRRKPIQLNLFTGDIPE